jgi:nitroreductase
MTLIDFVVVARDAPSAANLQPLRYIIETRKDNCDSITKNLKFGSLIPNGQPTEDEYPPAYIIIYSDPSINAHPEIDVGIAAAHIVLYAQSLNIGSCILASFSRDHLSTLYPKNSLHPELVIALGYPKQLSKTDMYTDSTKYWCDDDGIIHVPKRCLQDIVTINP